MADHVLEAVAPSELIGQVGLARHEVIARFCRALKGDDDLCIHLQDKCVIKHAVGDPEPNDVAVYKSKCNAATI